MSEVEQWFAIYTKPRWEKKVNTALQRKGIESWCPLQKVERQWSDRKKVIEDPLFKSYVFVRINLNADKLNVLMTDGVLNFVHYLGKPAIIKEDEVENIKKYLAIEQAKIEVRALEGYKEQEKVRISHGVFMDNEGTVIRGGRKKVYVEIKSLGQVMIVEFPIQYLSPA